MPTRAEIIDDHFRSKNYYPWVKYRELGRIIVEEVGRMGPGGLYLSTACALVEQESGGKQIFGCDWGSRWTNEPPYCQVEVTKERVKALIRNVENGGGQNGVGTTQLTSIGYVYEAEKMGGAHLARYQMRVGFRVLNDMIAQLGWPAGAAAYNAGAGNWWSVVNTYGASMARLEREWAARLARAADGRGAEPPKRGTPEEGAERAIDLLMRLRGAPYGTGWRLGTWPDGPSLYARCDPKRHTEPYMREREIVCSGAISIARAHVAGLPAIGRAQGHPWPGGTGAIGDVMANLPGTRPYPPAEPTPRGWLVYAPYIGAALPLQGHVEIALGDYRTIGARVPRLDDSVTEDEMHRRIIAGGGRGYTRIIPPEIWLGR